VLLVAALILIAVRGNLLSGLLQAGGASTPSAQVTQTPITSPITDNFTVNTNGWPAGAFGNDNGLVATLGQGKYAISISPDQNHNRSYFLIPSKLDPAPANFTLEIKVQQLSGATILGFGLIVREAKNGNTVRGYAFTINSSGGYQFVKYPFTDTSASFTNRPDIIHTGLSQINDLKVVARGGVYTFYVNGQVVPLGANGADNVTDAKYSTGNVGLLVTADGVNLTQFEFSDFSLTPTP
jgi:hypothetical protein